MKKTKLRKRRVKMKLTANQRRKDHTQMELVIKQLLERGRRKRVRKARVKDMPTKNLERMEKERGNGRRRTRPKRGRKWDQRM